MTDFPKSRKPDENVDATDDTDVPFTYGDAPRGKTVNHGGGIGNHFTQDGKAGGNGTVPSENYMEATDKSYARDGGPKVTDNHSIHNGGAGFGETDPHIGYTLATDNHSMRNSGAGSAGMDEAEGRIFKTQEPTRKTQEPKYWKSGERVLNGRYTILDVAGKGGMGIVYKCDKKIGKNKWTTVALKTVLSGGRISEADSEQIESNFRLAHELKQENILSVNSLEYDETTGQYYVEMDWVEGESLETHFNQFGGDRLLVAHETVRVMRKVANALDYAHGKGVTHRDVKKANIMIDKVNGKVLLIDFGIACREIRPFGTENLLRPEVKEVMVDFYSGTPGYQSPEQWEGQRPVPASDQYSLAVTAYECLAGRLPFDYDGDNKNGFCMPPIRWLGEQANCVLEKAMSKKPEDRYGSCVEFIDALEKSINDEPIEKERVREEKANRGEDGKQKRKGREFDVDELIVLWSKVEEYYKEYENTEWDRGQTFGTHLDLFKRWWRAAETAASDRFKNMPKAYGYLQSAEEEWKWLEINKELREQTAKLFDVIRQLKAEADARNARQYAEDDYQEALKKLNEAENDYEAGEFTEAQKKIFVADGYLKKAMEAKKARIDSLMTAISNALVQNDFAIADKTLRELESADAEKATELAEKIKIAKTERVEYLVTAIFDALFQNDFDLAEKTLLELKQLDTVIASEQAKEIKSAKAERAKYLVKAISEAVPENDFEEAEKNLQELAGLDAKMASKTREEINAAKSLFVEEQKEVISVAVLIPDFPEAYEPDFPKAYEALRKLEKVDSTAAVFQSAKIEAAKNNHIDNLEASITTHLRENDFPGIEKILRELEALDAEMVAGLSAWLEAVKKISYELYELDMVDSTAVLELGSRFKEARANYILNLKASIYDAISHKDLERAKKALDKLSIVDSTTEETKPSSVNRKYKAGEKILGRYQVVELLGQDEMKEVYYCLDIINQKTLTEVAVRRCCSHYCCYLMSTEEIQELQENYELVSKLIHANIAVYKKLEIERSTGNCYLVMEYAGGGNLRHWMSRLRKEGKMSLETALPVLRQIAETLDFIHGQAVIHRDIKPDNIRIMADGTLKLIGFEIATSTKTCPSTRVGTPLYMSPEQWKGKQLDASTDQYSLAVMAYEMLAGHVPFDSHNLHVLENAVLHDIVVPVKGLPLYANEALNTGLAKRASKRFANCLDFVCALSGGIYGIDSESPPRTKDVNSGHITTSPNFDSGPPGTRPNSSVPYTTIPWWIGHVSDVKVNIGDSIARGRYTVLSSAGRGGMGHVYKAHDNIEEKDVALKFVRVRERESMETTVRQIQKRLKWIKGLNRHSGIVCAERLELDDEKGLWFVVMDFVEGETLRDYIKDVGEDGCLDFAETVRICRQIAGTLDYMHERHLVHCDVKSTNILIRDNKDYDAVLIDFGLTEKLDDDDMLSRKGQGAGGTIGYMSPEQANGKEVTSASDQYSLAVTVYECLGGRMQSESGTVSAAQNARITTEPKKLSSYAAWWIAAQNARITTEPKITTEPNPHWRSRGQERILDIPALAKMPKAVNAVLRKAMSEDPEERYGSCMEFMEKLDAAWHEAPLDEDLENESVALRRMGFDIEDEELYENQEEEADKEEKKGGTSGGKDEHSNLTFTLPGGVKLEMVWVEPGSFKDDKGKEMPWGYGYGYWIGKYPFTVGQWDAVMTRKPRLKDTSFIHFTGDAMNYVSWDDACDCIKKLNELLAQQVPDGWCFDLPNAREWRFASRVVQDSEEKYGIWSGIRTGIVHNELGIYYMVRNVWEWCKEQNTNEIGSALTNTHVICGLTEGHCTAFVKDNMISNEPKGDIVFRVILRCDEHINILSELEQPKRPLPSNDDIVLVFPGHNLPGTTNTVSMTLKPVHAGSFMMGSPADELHRFVNEKLHKVTLTKDYWLGETVVTQEQYAVVMEGVKNNEGKLYDAHPSDNKPGSYREVFDFVIKKGEYLPVEFVSWDDARRFCEELNRRFKSQLPDGYHFDLPTEAQWEYAARGGHKSHGYHIFSGSDNSEEVAWYYRKGKKSWGTHPVARKKANELGLYDMSGNVFEWCRDWFGEYPIEDVTDPLGPSEGTKRVLKGGSWMFEYDWCRSAFRLDDDPSKGNSDKGFRIALVSDDGNFSDSGKEEVKSQSRKTNRLGGLGDSDLFGAKEKPANNHSNSNEDIVLSFPGHPHECSMTLKPIRAGSFMMGSPDDEPGRYNDERRHEVLLTKSYWLAETAVTQGQWKAVMGTTLIEQANKEYPGKGDKHIGVEDDDYPMYWVNWHDAMEFCRKLTEKERKMGRLPNGYEYSLPTEAQWENACRAGTDTALYNGSIKVLGENNAPALDKIAWYGGNSSVGYDGGGWSTDDWKEKQYPGGLSGPRKVGEKKPNGYGLYDMLGNVWEWCYDWYGSYPAGTVTDPVGPCIGRWRVCRGGSWGLVGQPRRVLPFSGSQRLRAVVSPLHPRLPRCAGASSMMTSVFLELAEQKAASAGPSSGKAKSGGRL